MKPFKIHLFRTALLFKLLAVSTAILAQDPYIVINGLLKDAKTGDKISYATITVPGTGIGTVSNSDGEFILKISKPVKAEYFEVSHLSYMTARFRIEEYAGKESIFLLEIQPVMLKEIPVVTGDAKGVVTKAMDNIRHNYSEIPSMMTGFYRESVMQRRDYLSVAEAVVDIYKAPYTNIETDQVKIYKGRKASNVKKADTLAVKLQGGPYVLMLLDIIKNPDLSISFSDLDNYRFEFESPANIDGKQHWVVSFVPAVAREDALYQGKLYITQDNYAITRAEFGLDLSDATKAAAAFVKKKPIGLVFTPASTGYLLTYKENNGKYYLSYVRVDLKFRCDWKRRLFKNNYTLVSEIAITGRSGDNVERFPGNEAFKSTMILDEKVENLNDKDFWGEYNIIEPENSIEEAIRKISKGKK